MDEALVRQTARQLGLRFAAGKADVRRMARKQKLSPEMAARQARHDFLARTARRLGLKRIALAHHADDQIELFFIRLLRGSGGEGLGGMKWHGPSPAYSRVQLTRPLLNLSKQDLELYAHLHNLKFREDATNRSLDILRNRIRRELLPLLRSRYQPGLDKTIQRTSEIIGTEAELVSIAARTWLRRKSASARRQPFDQLAIAVQRRVIQVQLAELGIESEFDLVERLRLRPNNPITVPAGGRNVSFEVEPARKKRPPLARPLPRGGGGRSAAATLQVVRREDGRLRLINNTRFEFNPASTRHVLRGQSGSVQFEGLRVDWRLINRSGASRAKGRSGCEWFDRGAVGREITLRHWVEGDRIQPIGMPKSVKLQDLFTNMKIPREQRHQLVVAEAENGRIYWVEGLRISEQFKLKTGTKSRLEWRWKRAGMRVAV